MNLIAVFYKIKKYASEIIQIFEVGHLIFLLHNNEWKFSANIQKIYSMAVRRELVYDKRAAARRGQAHA